MLEAHALAIYVLQRHKWQRLPVERALRFALPICPEQARKSGREKLRVDRARPYRHVYAPFRGAKGLFSQILTTAPLRPCPVLS